MKKLSTFFAVILLGVVAIAQNSRKTFVPHLSNPQLIDAQIPKLKNRAPLDTHALGDTVFVFDGSYYYDWNGTLPSTFTFKLEDIDSYTISTGLQPYFGTKGSFSFFYELDSTSTLLYNHPDTVFYAAATSYFKTPAKANNWFELGPIHVPNAGGTLKWRDNFPDNKYRDAYEILVNTVGLGSTNFTNAPVFSVVDNDPITVGDTVTTPYYEFVQYSANVSTYAGKDIYVAVHHTGNDQFILQVTDIILTEGSSSGVNENSSIISVLQNIPNPASNNTVITYSLKEASNVELSLFDITGKNLRHLKVGMESSGSHQVRLDVSELPSGMYFYTISTGKYTTTKKMSIVR